MDEKLNELLESLHRFGTEHDSRIKDHAEQMLNITPDTGLFLSILIQATRAKQVLEIGTSNGYSTIWIADALSKVGGVVTTIEISKKKFEMAKKNFNRSGLSRYIDSRLGDVRNFLREVEDESIDLIFLDAERPQYVTYRNDLDRILKKNGLLVVDNALAPKPRELANFFKLLQASDGYLCQTLQIGKGEMIALKHGSTASSIKQNEAPTM
jgi:predicted O-methyltransferase YrrM